MQGSVFTFVMILIRTVLKFVLFYTLVFLFCFSALGQTSNDSLIRNELLFAQYLINKGNNNDAIYILEKIQTAALSKNSTDSLNYFLGWANYGRKELNNTIKYFDKITPDFKAFNKVVFFKAYANTFVENTLKASEILQQYTCADTNLCKLKTFEQAGIALLQRDINEFNNYAQNFKFDYYPTAVQEENLIGICGDIEKFKPKSLFVAGALSAIVPGLGKIYIGNIGEGVAAFFTVGALMAVATENLVKDGITDYKTILTGTVASIFYIGNIYGSVAALKVKREKFNDEVNNQILFELHIPLRTVFN